MRVDVPALQLVRTCSSVVLDPSASSAYSLQRLPGLAKSSLLVKRCLCGSYFVFRCSAPFQPVFWNYLVEYVSISYKIISKCRLIWCTKLLLETVVHAFTVHSSHLPIYCSSQVGDISRTLLTLFATLYRISDFVTMTRNVLYCGIYYSICVEPSDAHSCKFWHRCIASYSFISDMLH